MLIPFDDHNLAHALLANHKLRLLAEGDSWFSAGGWFNGSILTALNEAHPDWLIVNCAMPGDEAQTMVDVADFGAYSWMLRPTEGVPKWDALLLSMGGNDLLTRIGALVDGDGVLDDALSLEMDRLAKNITRMITTARVIQPGIPVVLHTYDYIEPVTRRRAFQPGPWVGPQLHRVGMHPYFWQETSNIIIDSIGACIDRIARAHAGVHVVHSAGTLTPGFGLWLDKKDYSNEIHPSRSGYHKLLPQWEQAIRNATKGEPA